MKSICSVVFLLIILSGCVKHPPQKQSQNENPLMCIKGGILIDPSGKEGDISNAYVLYEGNEIIEVGEFTEEMKIPEGAEIIDAAGRYACGVAFCRSGESLFTRLS